MADYFESGFTVREASWHGKETVLAEHPDNWDDARLAAGLLWEPRLVPLYRKVITTRPARPSDAPDVVYAVDGERFVDEATYVEADSARMVERDDTGADLGVVTDKFELLTHGQMGPILEAIQGQGNVKYETAGSVRGGRMVYALLRLDEPYTITGDVDGFGDPVLTFPYLALLNSHDGTGACKVLYTQVRVVCWNTVQAADADGDRHGAQFSFRHTVGMADRIEDAKNAMNFARAEMTRWQEMAAELHAITITDEQQQTFLNEFMPMPPTALISDRVRDNVERDRAKFMHVLNDSLTNCEMSHTGLGLVNAAVEYLDHVRGFRTRNTYLGRQLLRPEPYKAKAVRLVRELANA